jgi:hypothetical protein
LPLGEVQPLGEVSCLLVRFHLSEVSCLLVRFNLLVRFLASR